MVGWGGGLLHSGCVGRTHRSQPQSRVVKKRTDKGGRETLGIAFRDRRGIRSHPSSEEGKGRTAG